MYLNLIQIAASFEVPEKVVEDWIRREGLPHTSDGGRLLFDREQVAAWAASRGLAARTGFFARIAPPGTGFALTPLLRVGGVWRDVAGAEVAATFERIVAALPGTTEAVRELVAQRLRKPRGVTFAPVGGGFALPHPTVRVALGRDSGTLALLLLRDGLQLSGPRPDSVPITRLFFLIAPSPRAHLELLGRLSRNLARGPLREVLGRGATDEEIFEALAVVDEVASAVAPREGTP